MIAEPTTPTFPLPVGDHEFITPTDYHSWRLDLENPSAGPISCSLLKRYAELGPLAFRCSPSLDKRTDAMTWGSLVDCLLFTPHLFPREFVYKEQCPALSKSGTFGTKEARAWRDEHLEAGRNIITEDVYEAAKVAVDRIRNTSIAEEIFGRAISQRCLVTESCDIPIKNLLDAVPAHLDHDDALVDLKTTACNLYDDDALARQVGSLRYHWQAAMYLHAWNTLHPDDPRREFLLVFQSSSPPYEVRVVTLDDQWLDAGRAAVRYHLPRLIRDLKTNSFRSPFTRERTSLPLHNPTVYAEERRQELFSELPAA